MNKQIIAIYNTRRVRFMEIMRSLQERRLTCVDRQCTSVEDCDNWTQYEYLKLDTVIAKLEKLEQEFQEVVKAWKQVKWYHRLYPSKANRLLRKQAFQFFLEWRHREPGW